MGNEYGSAFGAPDLGTSRLDEFLVQVKAGAALLTRDYHGILHRLEFQVVYLR
jgi:hypothetical protein